MGALAVLYVVFTAATKPASAPQGYARFAAGAMSRLVVIEDPPEFPAKPLSTAGAQPTATLVERYSGEVTVLNLWATWCAPCMREMPTLGALARRFQGRGLDVVAISVDGEDDRAKAETELARLTDGALAFWNDPSRDVLFDLRAGGMPTTIIYRNRREVARLTGGADWSSPEAVALMEAALAED